MEKQEPLFHWDHFRKEVLQRFGVDKETVTLNNMDMSWINQYVEHIIKNSVPNNVIHIDDEELGKEEREEERVPTAYSYQSEQVNKKNTRTNSVRSKEQAIAKIEPETFETIDHIILLFSIAKKQADQLRFFLHGNSILVRHIETGEEQKIKLPSGISINEATAYHKDNTLEIRIKKDDDIKTVPIPIEFK